MRLHAHIGKTRYEKDTFLANLLTDMYGKCGRVELARAVFDKLLDKDVYSWNAMIAAYVQNGHTEEALEVFQKMKQGSILPDKVTFATIINACASPALLDKGRLIHDEAVGIGCHLDLYVGTALINMYGKCGNLDNAYEVFEKLPDKTVISWTAMVGAYVEAGHDEAALGLFKRMQEEGVKPNKVTFLTALNACSSPDTLAEGKHIHSLIVECDLELDLVVGTTLVNMYGNCGSPYEARRMFDKMHDRNLVSWNAMIAAYAKSGLGEETFQLFCQMQQESLTLDSITIVNMLDVFASSKVALEEDLFIYLLSPECELELDVFVRTAIITTYARRGKLDDARHYFERMPFRNQISWNAMISAYAQSGYGRQALQFFQEMQQRGTKPDKISYTSILDACADLADLAEGKWIHDCITEAGDNEDIVIANALVHMYGRCGSPNDALRTFTAMSRRNLVTWGVLIAAHAHIGLGKSALEDLGQMQWEGVNPDAIALVSVLSACSHAGLVDEGCQYFYSIGMETVSTEQYGCLIDLLARAGQLDEVKFVLTRMRIKPDAVMCMTLLDACRMHGDTELGRFAMQHLLELDPNMASKYTDLRN
ncbi:hypothetical protein O6H91_02G014100 [Diphasiastrum complanatum]|nr:hypothetical protein O6H91_02G014100 [Diphasiastrum complanatum]KAJ7564369.1 hypothetical protein O6H91_02G014100 [Diphasiastrum complanatum]